MKNLNLPLVESLVAEYPGLCLSNIKIIGVQHILETTHAMFQSLYKLGLRPENISIIGKCYSTCKDVYEEMLVEGIDVSPGSFEYSSHMSYDQQFSDEIHKFFKSRFSDLSSGKYEQIIVLDDGGKCINFLSQYWIRSIPIVAIEQTSSGYEAIRDKKIPFPVINVARSPVKLTHESPMIAQAASERLYNSLKKRSIFPKSALVIGGGVIGLAMKQRLSPEMDIYVYDQIKARSSKTPKHFNELISAFPLIIGCTGQTSLPNQLHSLLSNPTVLVSVSSSDREFDAVHLRKFLPENRICHHDLSIKNIYLINSGFPVNFDGDRENIDPERIQLTIALITAGILQARSLINKSSGDIIPLYSRIEEKIEKEFLQIDSNSI